MNLVFTQTDLDQGVPLHSILYLLVRLSLLFGHQ